MKGANLPTLVIPQITVYHKILKMQQEVLLKNQ